MGRVLLKFERERFGLPAFKFLGVSWAAERLLGEPPHEPGLELVAATDGNHGRAVARVARLAGLGATILVPAGTAQARIDAIAGEGAAVEVVDGSYDDAVRLMAAMADERRLVLSDTSWPGYEEVPRWVIEGYATIFHELDEQLDGGAVDIAFVPIGVGALAAAAARHLAGTRAARRGRAHGRRVHARVRAGRPDHGGAGAARLHHGRAERRPAVASRVAPGERGIRAVLRRRGRARGGGHAQARPARVGGGRVLRRRGGGGRGGCSRTQARATRSARGPDSAVLVLLTEGVTDPEAFRRIIR